MLFLRNVVLGALFLISTQLVATESTYDRTFPLFAQQAIDTGVDLPLPFGVGFVYNYTEQDFILDDLSIFAKDGSEVDIDHIVALRNAKPASHSVQLKVDAFVLPFLNVFAMLGGITGETPLDITLNRPLKPDLNFSVDAAVRGYNFTGGMMFATKYDKYFISVPISYTYSMLERSYDYRKVISVVPRFGNIIPLQEHGKVAVFMGANYMDVDLNNKGEFIDDDDGRVLVYEVHQKNVDKWNMSLGYNWMFSKELSWNLEVGFLGSRNNLTTGLTYRY